MGDYNFYIGLTGRVRSFIHKKIVPRTARKTAGNCRIYSTT